MIAFESNHDENAKTVLGSIIPPGQTAFADLTAALSIIFNHPNVGPFVSKNLIQHLVTSNPSPAYVGRVAAVFNNNGAGVRGDLKAVVQAILLDPEARQGDSSASPTEGHLREPILLAVSALRGLGASVNDSNTLAPLIAPLGQNLFFPPSVFNYYAPNYMVPASLTAGGPALLGPEFQLHSPSSALGRADLINTFLYSKTGSGDVVDLTPFISLAGTPQLLLDKINTLFFAGRCPAPCNSTSLPQSMELREASSGPERPYMWRLLPVTIPHKTDGSHRGRECSHVESFLKPAPARWRGCSRAVLLK